MSRLVTLSAPTCTWKLCMCMKRFNSDQEQRGRSKPGFVTWVLNYCIVGHHLMVSV